MHTCKSTYMYMYSVLYVCSCVIGDQGVIYCRYMYVHVYVHAWPNHGFTIALKQVTAILIHTSASSNIHVCKYAYERGGNTSDYIS